jgi:hypothetical protein
MDELALLVAGQSVLPPAEEHESKGWRAVGANAHGRAH